jgi:hypothetical protein
LSFTRGQWTDAGSKEAIRSFFEKTLAYFRHIDRLCGDLKVRVFDPKSDGGASGFLGQGGFGRVIRVLPKEGGSTRPSGCDVLALKFGQIPEEANNDSELRAEYRGLREHSQDCTCSLVARPTSDFAATSGLCGFVMSPVGATCTRELVFEKKKPSLTAVLMALNSLHCHSPPILHGDPHLPNLIIIGERLTWIDLRQSAQDSTLIDATEFAGDMHKLIVSLFPALKDHVDETVNTLIDSYGEHRDEESIQALVSYLGTTRRS